MTLKLLQLSIHWTCVLAHDSRETLFHKICKLICNVFFTGLRNRRHLVLDHFSQRSLLQFQTSSLARMGDTYLVVITWLLRFGFLCFQSYDAAFILNIMGLWNEYPTLSDFESWWLFGCQLWDINMDSGPVETFQVHEYLRPKVRLPLPFFEKNWTINFYYYSNWFFSLWI